MGATCGGIFGDYPHRKTVPADSAFGNMVTLLTPNLPEARILAGHPSTDDPHEIAGAIYRRINPEYLLIKGRACNLRRVRTGFLHRPPLRPRRAEAIYEISMPRIDSQHTHGTGCALSSAIACGLAKGQSVQEATYNGCLFPERSDIAREETPGYRFLRTALLFSQISGLRECLNLTRILC